MTRKGRTCGYSHNYVNREKYSNKNRSQLYNYSNNDIVVKNGKIILRRFDNESDDEWMQYGTHSGYDIYYDDIYYDKVDYICKIVKKSVKIVYTIEDFKCQFFIIFI